MKQILKILIIVTVW